MHHRGGPQTHPHPTPSPPQAVNFLTTTEPVVLGEYALGLLALYYLGPPVLKAGFGALRGYAGGSQSLGRGPAVCWLWLRVPCSPRGGVVWVPEKKKKKNKRKGGSCFEGCEWVVSRPLLCVCGGLHLTQGRGNQGRIQPA